MSTKERLTRNLRDDDLACRMRVGNYSEDANGHCAEKHGDSIDLRRAEVVIGKIHAIADNAVLLSTVYVVIRVASKLVNKRPPVGVGQWKEVGRQVEWRRRRDHVAYIRISAMYGPP